MIGITRPYPALRRLIYLFAGLAILLSPRLPALGQNPAGPTAENSATGYKSEIWKVIPAEYRCWYIRSDSTVWAYNNAAPLPVRFPMGKARAVTGAGGFNYFRVIDDHGFLWTSVLGMLPRTARTETDTLGRPFDGNHFVDAYAHTCMTIRGDSSIWYLGVDAFSLFYPNGNLVLMTGAMMQPTQLSPKGVKFKKVLFGGIRIIGLTTTGEVYQWLAGNHTPTRMKIPRPATDIFVGHLDFAGCIIPDPGETSGMGYPYIWGGCNALYGSPTALSEPASVKALWKMKAPIKEITTSSNTIHYIDSLGHLYGIGFNSLGEVGNGREFVNQYNYPHFPDYAWTYIDYENPTGPPPIRIGGNITWKHLWSNNFYTLYTYAQDIDNNLYSWGRNKAVVLGNGFNNRTDQFHPDALDVLTPTMVHPFSSRYQDYIFSPPSIHVGNDTTITGPTLTLTGSASPLRMVKATPVAANGIDSIPYKIVAWRWTQKKGRPGARINSPESNSTTVTGLLPGVYTFNLSTTDNNTGTQSVDITVTVKSSARQ
jgi:hypothetical protein